MTSLGHNEVMIFINLEYFFFFLCIGTLIDGVDVNIMATGVPSIVLMKLIISAARIGIYNSSTNFPCFFGELVFIPWGHV